MRSFTLRLVLTTLLATSACSDSQRGPTGDDYPLSRAATIPIDGQVLFPVQVDDRTGFFPMVVDTGAFATTVDQRLVREIVNDVGVATLTFAEDLVFEDTSVFATDLSVAESYIGVPIYGLIGQDILQHTFFGLDYRASEVTAASAVPELPPPAFADETGIDVPYQLEQQLPVVEVDIGGKKARLIADTGSGVTLLRESFVSRELLDAGLGGYWWHTSYGSDPGVIVRLPSVVVGGHEVAQSWAVVVPDDYHLKPVFEGLGVEVDGILGYPLYRRFYVAVHGPESKYRFYPYDALPHVDGREWDRAGLEIRRDQGAVLVDMIFEPSDAKAKGVRVDDTLVSIGSQSVGDLPLDTIRLMLRGEPGELKKLEFERDGSPIILQVAVDRLLPALD